MKAATLALNRSLPGFRGSRRVREAFPSLGMAAAVREVWATKAAWFKKRQLESSAVDDTNPALPYSRSQKVGTSLSSCPQGKV